MKDMLQNFKKTDFLTADLNETGMATTVSSGDLPKTWPMKNFLNIEKNSPHPLEFPVLAGQQRP